MGAVFKKMKNFSADYSQLQSKFRHLYLRPIPVFLLCSFLIVFTVLANSNLAENREKNDMHSTLSSVGKLVVGEVNLYLTERKSDAYVLLDILHAIPEKDWLNASGHLLPSEMQQATDSIRRTYHYKSIFVLDSQENIRIVSGQDAGLTSAGESLALQAAHDRTPVVSLYAGNPSVPEETVLDIFVPILNQDKKVILGIIVMRANPDPLFKLLQSWPTASETAEILLVTKDGNDVLFLNKPRHMENAKFKQRISLTGTSSTTDWSVVSAVKGLYGSLEASDGRGKPVLAYSMPVPNTLWSVVVKIDRDEALQHSQQLRWIAFVFAMILIVLIGALIWQWWSRAKQDRQANAKLRETEANLNRAQEVSRVGSWMLDMRSNALTWSAECYRIFGLEPGAALTYETFLARVHPDDREFVDCQWKAALQGQPYDVEHRLVINGQVIWVRERAELQFGADGQLVGAIGTAQDITERKLLKEELLNSREKFMKVFDQAPLGMVIRDKAGVCIQSNQAYQKIFGYSGSELEGSSLQQLAHPDDKDEIVAVHKWVMQGFDDKYHQEDRRYLRKDGEVIWGRAILALVYDVQKNPCFTITMFENISERKQVEEEMQIASLVYQSSNEAMQVTDADDRIIAINPAFTEITGYSASEAVGKGGGLLKSGIHTNEFYDAMWEQLLNTGRWQGEIWNRRKNGELFVERLSINTIFNDDASVHRRVALFSDITDKKKNEEIIWNQANYDSLTNLPNRYMFHNSLEHAIEKTQQTQLPFALLFIDLDRFKEVNDTLGHEVGDILLRDAAMRIKSCVRESDIVGRFGGDEFTVILNNLADVGCIDRIANNLLMRLGAPFELGSEMVYISACIGIALHPRDAADVTTILKCADQAMYAAKKNGEGHFGYYTSTMQEAINIRTRMINDMHIALGEQEFRVHYQPIVDLSTGYIHKAEALIRWQHPELGLISPAEFIPIAEETGLIVEIGDWVFYQAATQAAHVRATYNPEFQISVNKSPVQFMADTNRHLQWLTHLDKVGLPRQAVVIEITEGLLMETKDQISSQLLTFRDNGIQVALDDFGTGYSSLAYLKKFDIDYIKIDRSFISNLAAGTNDMVLCEAIIKMAHELDIKIIAEGIETEDQYTLLQQMGCDFGQGYFFSKPLPSEEFEKMLFEHPNKNSGGLFDKTIEESANTIQ